MRIILIFRKLFVSLLLSACAVTRAAGQANDSLAVARRIVAATALAAKEYAAGVVPRGGRVTAAAEVDEALENIGARRLQTVMEKLLEEVSFTAEDRKGESLVVDKAFVEAQLASIARNADLSRYVL